MRTFAIETTLRTIEIVTTPIALAGIVFVLFVVFSGAAGRAVLYLESRSSRIGSPTALHSQLR